MWVKYPGQLGPFGVDLVKKLVVLQGAYTSMVRDDRCEQRIWTKSYFLTGLLLSKVTFVVGPSVLTAILLSQLKGFPKQQILLADRDVCEPGGVQSFSAKSVFCLAFP